MPRPRKDKILPKVLSQQDVIKLIEGARMYKHQIFLTFVYATGLRLSEALAITFEDIDGDRLQIRVNKGKGHKDRCVQIPQCLINLLREPIINDVNLRNIYLMDCAKEIQFFKTSSPVVHHTGQEKSRH